mmetsp:Transcript_14072/g.34945  ORF Transcript_14072/g.34945 Transcript_14072/m.34945 type:complete len:256 (-) Transcript_14072:69-836(-)
MPRAPAWGGDHPTDQWTSRLDERAYEQWAYSVRRGPLAVRRDSVGRVQLRVEGPVLQAYTPPATLGAALGAGADVLIMAAAWLSFVAIWTGGAYRAGAPLPFVCFSAPFWFAGAQMLGNALRPMLVAELLTLNEQGAHLAAHLVLPGIRGAELHRPLPGMAPFTPAALAALPTTPYLAAAAFVPWADVPRPLDLYAIAAHALDKEAATLRADASLPRHLWGGGLGRAELAFVDGEVRRHLVSPLALCASAIPNRC